MKRLFLSLIFSSTLCSAQLRFNENELQLGEIKEAYEISGDIVLRNTADKKIFLLRADAEKGLKVFASKKTLQPGDTALLILTFVPESAGKFKKKISLVTSDQAKPYQMEMSGDLKEKLKNDQQACFYFGSRSKKNVKIKEGPIVIEEPAKSRDNSNKIPDKPYRPVITFSETPSDSVLPDPRHPVIVQKAGELSVLHYKPNNIVFLVDVSSSMKDSAKLPLMKEALFVLIDALRDMDRISFITYADTVTVLKESMKGSDKKEMKALVASFKGQGYTKGRKAILKAREVSEKHFIEEGNNQIFLATDGMFYFYAKDKENWKLKNESKRVVMTTVAFGNDNAALKNLKEIADAGEGSFIRIKKKHGSEEELLNEVKLRSKR